MKILLTALCLFAVVTLTADANNLQIANVTMTGQNTTSNYTMISFDVSWENSWRDNSNYDAVWLFVKWSTDNGFTWQHALLSPTPANHTAPSGATVSPASDSTGVFLYRTSSGSGTTSWTNVQLRWEYGQNGVNDNAFVRIKVFGTEMVYIPSEAFFVGDVNPAPIASQFETGNTGAPFQISSENALTLGGTSSSNLSNRDGVGGIDDFDYATTKTLPAAYPKGFAAYFCMKYEITQEQYKDFLNTLTRTQQGTRVGTNISGTTIVNKWVMSNSASIVGRNGIRAPYSVGLGDPITFHNDFMNDSVYNQSDDGQNIQANYLSMTDVKAYLDWAGLRPMSELEFEKACRGPLPPHTNEWAWGDTVRVSPLVINNVGTANESTSTSGANCHFGTSTGGLRVGMFATSSSTRRDAGASYYGVMELSGGMAEQVYTLSLTGGRGFTGTHGDGRLDANGDANTTGWPTTLNVRGGASNSATQYVYRVADRTQTGSFYSGRNAGGGGRGVRTAP